MKDEHLIPPIVSDLVEQLLSDKTRENERANYYHRVAAIHRFCEAAVSKADKKAQR
ncbi:MAG: hypothetical protein ACXV2C_00220 [Candidatus Bathyarchaeia archaeon]